MTAEQDRRRRGRRGFSKVSIFGEEFGVIFEGGRDVFMGEEGSR